MRLRLAVAAIIVRKFADGNKFLACKNKEYPDKILSGMWGLPSGHVEEGETPDTAVSRETVEEAHLKAKVAELIDVHYRLSFDELGRPTTTVIFYFLMEEEDATAEPIPGDDVEELRFVDTPEFAKLVGSPFIQARIPGTVWNKLSSINST